MAAKSNSEFLIKDGLRVWKLSVASQVQVSLKGSLLVDGPFDVVEKDLDYQWSSPSLFFKVCL